MDEPDPPPEPETWRPRRLLGPGFWIAIAFGVLCVAAGYALAKLGPKILPPSAAEPVQALGNRGQPR